MLYCVLGTVSSKDEEQTIISAVARNPGLRKRLVEYCVHRQELRDHGFRAVEDAWIELLPGRLVLFTGRSKIEEPTKSGGSRIFAAIKLVNNRAEALIKIHGDYRGESKEYNDHCDDAVDRLKNGTLVP